MRKRNRSLGDYNNIFEYQRQKSISLSKNLVK